MKTKTIQKEEETLNLETEPESKLDTELKLAQDPARQEEAKRRLGELAAKLIQLSKESDITIKKIYEESKQEYGLINKVAHWIKRLKDKAKSDGSTSFESINFLTATVRAINEYQQKIPIYIQEFQITIAKLKLGQVEATKVMKAASDKVKQLSKEWELAKKAVETETDIKKKEALKIKEQDLRDAVQNAEIRGNKYMKKLQNYTYTREMFLGLKSAYETLLQQLGDLEEALREHLKILKTVGPSVKEVERVVISISRFTQTVDEYRKRDNLAVRFATAAVKDISPSVQSMHNPWYGKKTAEIVKENAKKAREIYKESFGTNVKTLEELEKNPPKEDEQLDEAFGSSEEVD